MFQLRTIEKKNKQVYLQCHNAILRCNVVWNCQRLSFTLIWVGRRWRSFGIDNGRLRQAFTSKLQITSFQPADIFCFEFCALSRKVAKFSIRSNFSLAQICSLKTKFSHSFCVKFVHFKGFRKNQKFNQCAPWLRWKKTTVLHRKLPFNWSD